MARPPRTVLEYAVARGGYLKGARVAEFVALWAIASHALGGPVGIEAVVEWWGKGLNRATAYRRLADFRALFPEHESPQVIVDHLVGVAITPRTKPRELVGADLDFVGLAAA